MKITGVKGQIVLVDDIGDKELELHNNMQWIIRRRDKCTGYILYLATGEVSRYDYAISLKRENWSRIVKFHTLEEAGAKYMELNDKYPELYSDGKSEIVQIRIETFIYEEDTIVSFTPEKKLLIKL